MKFFLQFNTDIVFLTASAFLTKHAKRPSMLNYVEIESRRVYICTTSIYGVGNGV